jgi:hypothetical protein
MMSNDAVTEPWIRRPTYKFGMLLVLGVLALFHVWMLIGGSAPTSESSKIGLVAVSLMSLNHISLAFLRPSLQRRVMPLQAIIIVVGLAYVLVMFWQQSLRR